MKRGSHVEKCSIELCISSVMLVYILLFMCTHDMVTFYCTLYFLGRSSFSEILLLTLLGVGPVPFLKCASPIPTHEEKLSIFNPSKSEKLGKCSRISLTRFRTKNFPLLDFLGNTGTVFLMKKSFVHSYWHPFFSHEEKTPVFCHDEDFFSSNNRKMSSLMREPVTIITGAQGRVSRRPLSVHAHYASCRCCLQCEALPRRDEVWHSFPDPLNAG